MNFKKLDYNNLPEECNVYCDCGNKCRSEDNWWYSETLGEEKLKIRQLTTFFGINNAQKYTYKCPWCYSKENFNKNKKYKKSELIEFCKKYNIIFNIKETKMELYKKLINYLE